MTKLAFDLDVSALGESSGRCRQLAPELRIHPVTDEAAEQLDRRALRADDLVADHPRHDLVVPVAPDRDALVPLGE